MTQLPLILPVNDSLPESNGEKKSTPTKATNVLFRRCFACTVEPALFRHYNHDDIWFEHEEDDTINYDSHGEMWMCDCTEC